MKTKTEQWAHELHCAQWIQRMGRDLLCRDITLEQAHACWAEYSAENSDDWMEPVAFDEPKQALREAIAGYERKHGGLPTAQP